MSNLTYSTNEYDEIRATDEDGTLYGEGNFFKDYHLFARYFETHWNEIKGNNAEGMEFKLNTQFFCYLQKMGQLACFGCGNYPDDPKGYAGFLIYPHPFVKDQKVAQSQAFFVKPRCRKGLGKTLLKFSEKILKEKYGVNTVLLVSSAELDLGKYVQRLGYSLADKIYMKQVG